MTAALTAHTTGIDVRIGIAAGELWVGLDPSLDLGVEPFEMALDGLQLAAKFGPHQGRLRPARQRHDACMGTSQSIGLHRYLHSFVRLGRTIPSSRPAF